MVILIYSFFYNKNMKIEKQEIWMQIKNAKEGYKISNFGRAELNRVITYGYETNDGYLTIKITRNGFYHTYSIHRLVASHFIPNSNESNLEVDHIDGNKKNNYILNLQWLTKKENIIKSQGVSVIQTDLNGNFIKEFTNMSNVLDISHSNISAVIAGRRFSTGGYLWFSKLQYKNKEFVKQKVNKYYNKKR